MAEWITALATLLGGVIAAISVYFAIRSYNSSQKEKLLDQLRRDVVEVKLSYQDLDQSISGAYFIEASEILSNRIDRFIGEPKTIDNLVNFLRSEKSIISINRMLILSVEDSKAISTTRNLMDVLRRTVVGTQQTFPISGRVMGLCLNLTNNVARGLMSSHIFEQIIDQDYILEACDFLPKKSHNYQDALENFTSAVSDGALQFLTGNAQEVITQSGIIIYTICDMLTRKTYPELLSLSKAELGDYDSDSHSDTITGEIDFHLKEIRGHFSSSEWDTIWESRTKLNSIYEKAAKG